MAPCPNLATRSQMMRNTTITARLSPQLDHSQSPLILLPRFFPLLVVLISSGSDVSLSICAWTPWPASSLAASYISWSQSTSPLGRPCPESLATAFQDISFETVHAEQFLCTAHLHLITKPPLASFPPPLRLVPSDTNFSRQSTTPSQHPLFGHPTPTVPITTLLSFLLRP